MNYKAFFLSFVFFFLWVSAVSAQGNTYYVADKAECTSIKYICESGWTAFSDAKGCGCKKEEEDIVCSQEYEPVCGRPDYTCPAWVTCNRPLPKTYSNKCLLKAAGADYLSKWECKTQTELPSATDTKYYVGNTDKCMLIKYRCDTGWDYFSDTLGCGCKKMTKDKVIPLTSSLKIRLSDIVENFIEKLEKKYDSDEKKWDIIQDMKEKFWDLWENERYEEVVNYVIDLLEEYQEKLEDDLDVIEDIFDNF